MNSTNLACFSVPSAIASARLRAAFTSLTSATWASVPVPAAARLARKRRAKAGVSLSSEFWVWGSRWSSTKARTLQSFQNKSWLQVKRLDGVAAQKRIYEIPVVPLTSLMSSDCPAV